MKVKTIKVGTTNKAKIEAVEEMVREYPLLAGFEVVGVKAESGVSDQPMTIEETINGAMNRAKNAFCECHFSIGLESGLFPVPKSKTGYMDVCICAIYDGEEYFLGMSSAWEFPDKRITDLIVNEGLDMTQAVNKAGMTNNPTIGAAEGAIGILTKGRLTRKGYTKQALLTAMIHLEEHEIDF
ncbi:inosine/xanthosine triphosphatase [Candidatus Falkowbacteria bacterium]|nr:inosine/xanthosine triphosphatase [Candidatus Falkowbacteria bacterium]